MEINNLKTFLSVAKYGSFKKAAEKFFLSPRAVSKQMDQLENELGVTLFQRHQNSSELTKQGQKFIVAAQDMVNIYNDELNRIKNTKHLNQQLLRVGFSSANQEVELQHLLLLIFQKYPDIQLDFMQESRNRLLQLLQVGTLDIVISPVYATQTNITDSIVHVPVRTGQLLVGVSKFNPLAHQTCLTVEDISPFYVYYYSPYDSSFMQEVVSSKFPNQFPKDHIKRCSSLELRDAYVATNNGIGFYPSPFLELEKQRNPMIEFLSLAQPSSIFYASSVFYNKNNHKENVKYFINSLQKYELN